MTNNLYFTVDVFTKRTSDVSADSRFMIDALASGVFTADDKAFDIYEHISQTDSRFCIWQRF